MEVNVNSDDEHAGVHALGAGGGAGGGAAGGAADGLDAGVQAITDIATMSKMQSHRAREEKRQADRLKEVKELLDDECPPTPGVKMIGFGVNMFGCARITVGDPLRLVEKAKEMVAANPQLWPARENKTWCVYQTLRQAGFRPVQRGPRLDVPQNEQLYYHSWIPHKDSASESGRAAASKKQRSDP